MYLSNSTPAPRQQISCNNDDERGFRGGGDDRAQLFYRCQEEDIKLLNVRSYLDEQLKFIFSAGDL